MSYDNTIDRNQLKAAIEALTVEPYSLDPRTRAIVGWLNEEYQWLLRNTWVFSSEFAARYARAVLNLEVKEISDDV